MSLLRVLVLSILRLLLLLRHPSLLSEDLGLRGESLLHSVARLLGLHHPWLLKADGRVGCCRWTSQWEGGTR